MPSSDSTEPPSSALPLDASHDALSSLATLHPVSREWFLDTFAQPTPSQLAAWPAITSGQSTLLVAPTGSGKTLAAFFSSLDRLLFARHTSSAAPGVRVLYISPLKALGVDIERNLSVPLQGMVAEAERRGIPHSPVRMAIRSGDTSPQERERIRRKPPEILITTPESLYLMLTSRAREILRTVETVIVDEIHALVENKRGAHLFLSLERLEALRSTSGDALSTNPLDSSSGTLQRIGLSATQRPLDEVARLLGGFFVNKQQVTPRPVTIVDTGERKRVSLTVEVPTRDMERFSDALDWPATKARKDEEPPGPGSTSSGKSRSIWPAVYPRLVELIRSHRSTILFVNARGGAERLAAALNEVAEEDLARAHHGSLAHAARADVEAQLKEGKLKAIVATASLELGIDMGAVDLVIQVEAPPSISSGLQRIGRACHHVGGTPEGVTFPKYRSDLLACAAATRAVLSGRIEATRYPRHPLDVLAQQIVAMVSSERLPIDALFDRIRGAAPFATLSREAFESVLDMLSGRYPSADFSDLRPRLTWDRISGNLSARRGASRLAVISGGTIPDRGLYGVFLSASDGQTSKRVGELDEEMVFESKIGDVFLLGASSWRIDEITPDRVLVTPAPGETARMPFWHGERVGRPLEFGREIGALARELLEMDGPAATALLHNDYHLDANATVNLLAYFSRQNERSDFPTDQRIVVERFIDEIGDLRVCILSPFGGRVHAPWAMAVRAHLRDSFSLEADVVWSDDGIVFRLSAGDASPSLEDFVPAAADIEELLIARLAETPFFAARFRENAGRALLLPKRRPGSRSPLWGLRRRAAALLAVAARYRDFPIVLETFRECLHDQFDVPGLKAVLGEVAERKIVVVQREMSAPSPYAAALLFQLTATFLYEADAPLAERRAHALTIDSERLRELMGEAALRELLDPEVIASVEASLLWRGRELKVADDLHDLLLVLGPRTDQELNQHYASSALREAQTRELVEAGRLLSVTRRDRVFFSAIEDAARLRDGLGWPVPESLPSAFSEPVAAPLSDLLSRFARSHGPFSAGQLQARFDLPIDSINAALEGLAREGQLTRGHFLPDGLEEEWCSRDVLRRLKRGSLARLRSQVEAVPQAALACFALKWHGIRLEPVPEPVPGTDAGQTLTRDAPTIRPISSGDQEALLDVIESLQGLDFGLEDLENSILPSRLPGFHPNDLDALCLAGDVIWQGASSHMSGPGRLRLYLTASAGDLVKPAHPLEGDRYTALRDALSDHGGLFFRDLAARLGGFPQSRLDDLWDLIGNGEVSSDTLAPLRSLLSRTSKPTLHHTRGRGRLRARPAKLPGSEGRFGLLRVPNSNATDPTTQTLETTRLLLLRHGLVTRETLATENLEGGFSRVYPVLKALEEQGEVRRGYFVEGLGATQFAIDGAEARLRDAHVSAQKRSVASLAAADPANLYGNAIAWPDDLGIRPERAAQARVILADGELVGFLSRSRKQLGTRLNAPGSSRHHALEALAFGLSRLVQRERTTLLVEQIDGQPARSFPDRQALERVGFLPSHAGLLLRATGF